MNLVRGTTAPFWLGTDRAGRFLRRGLGAGDYLIRIGRINQRVRLEAGEEYDAEFAMR